MKPLPSNYQWLAAEPGPKMLVEALKHFGILETAGPGNSADLMAWSQELGLSKVYTADSIAWCGLFMDIVATRAGKTLPFSNKDGLWARNWAKFGNAVPEAMLGDVLVFSRGVTAGHVGMYVGEDATCYHVLAGNQGDKVSIVRIEKSRCIAKRRAIFATGQPANVRRVMLAANGQISSNEA